WRRLRDGLDWLRIAKQGLVDTGDRQLCAAVRDYGCLVAQYRDADCYQRLLYPRARDREVVIPDHAVATERRVRQQIPDRGGGLRSIPGRLRYVVAAEQDQIGRLRPDEFERSVEVSGLHEGSDVGIGDKADFHARQALGAGWHRNVDSLELRRVG